MRSLGFALLFSVPFLVFACTRKQQPADDFMKLALTQKQHLRLSTYITAQTVTQMFSTEQGRREVLSLLHCYGITKVYFEVYREGLIIPPGLISESVQFLKKEGFEVSGGIATVPGNNFGVKGEGPLEWFNWQNKKTQNDLQKVMEESAPFFDSFIIDDFLCTADTSEESKAAKGRSSWSEYRRSLLTGLAGTVLINPAKAKNRNIRMIIKYPQWYDRFHLFGYDVDAESKLFDGIWVGTESRGQYTKHFGFVQPYEGFINFRWLSSVAGDKCGGAWFDHEDCTDIDFLDQAYQSVLAGAKEIIIFSFDSFISGHPGHHLLMNDFRKLANLAEAVASHPVKGPSGYKPPNSDAGGDLYLMDYIGMLGVSVVPVSSYPDSSGIIFLPTQASADSSVFTRIEKSLAGGARIIMTSGFLARAKDGKKIAALAGIKWPLRQNKRVYDKAGGFPLKIPVTTDYLLEPDGAETLLRFGKNAGESFLLTNNAGTVYVINTHTFSETDFESAGEHLLCPGQAALLELPAQWINAVRDVFSASDEVRIIAPSRVTVQDLAGEGIVIQNYNLAPCQVTLTFPAEVRLTDRLADKKSEFSGKTVNLSMAPRSRVFLSGH